MKSLTPFAWSAKVLENDWRQKKIVVRPDLLVFFKSSNIAWLARGKVVAKGIGMRRDNCYFQVSACAFRAAVEDVRFVLPLFFWVALWVVDVAASVADVLLGED